MIEELPKRVEVAPGPKPVAPERAPDIVPERGRESSGETPEETPISESMPPVVPPTTPVAAPVASPKDPVLVVIEQILSDGLGDLYHEMSPAAQEKFKVKGEETASKIQQMIASARVQARLILKLIRDWLRVIPGVNRFFLEQESKIKTDKILAYTEKNKKN